MGRFSLVALLLSLSALAAPQGLEKFRGDWVLDPCGRQIVEGRECPNPLYVRHFYRENKYEGLELLNYDEGRKESMYSAFDRANFSFFGNFATCSWVGTLRICHHTSQPRANSIVHRRSIRQFGLLGSVDGQVIRLEKSQACTRTPVDQLIYTYKLDGELIQQCVYVRPGSSEK